MAVGTSRLTHGFVRALTFIMACMACIASAGSAQAATAGEWCGAFGGWSATCEAGLTCQITIRIGPVRVGTCTAAERPACQEDTDCPHGTCERGVTCAGLDCPPPPPNRCTVCGDGSALRCRRAALPCPDGQVREIVEGCYGACVDRATCGPSSCEYDGQTYPVGASFPASDGCNTCRCADDGTPQCTLRLCNDTCRYDDPSTTWLGKDRDLCMRIDFLCPDTMEAFSDACGCGCRDVVQTGEGCDYGGVQHRPGDDFPSTDGCNTCTCSVGGAVGCTKRACAPAP